MTRLFIENREVELDKSVQFAITKQFEDLSNPTAIINDWSKTVSIPFTQKNSELFGHIYNPDRLIVAGSGSVGIYFDPTKRLNFRLQDGDNVLMTGYAKMNEVKRNNGKGTYEITLFGELGRVFREFKKISPILSQVDDNKYYVGDAFPQQLINKDLIYNCWNKDSLNLTKPISKANITDIIGFAPTDIGLSNNFDCNTVLGYKNETNKIEDCPIIDLQGNAVTLKEAYEKKGYDITSIIRGGFTQQQMGEFRSYLQTPYIFVPRLFEILANKSVELTGYDIEIDKEWASQQNPYWYKSIMFLEGFNIDGTDDIGYYGSCKYVDENYFSIPMNTYTQLFVRAIEQQKEIAVIDDGQEGAALKKIHFKMPEQETVSMAFSVPLRLFFDTGGSLVEGSYNLARDTGLKISVRAVGSNGYTKEFAYVYVSDDTIYSEPSQDSVSYVYIQTLPSSVYLRQVGWYFDLPLYFPMNKKLFGDEVTIYFNPKLVGNTTTPLRKVDDGTLIDPRYETLYYRNQGVELNKFVKLYNVVNTFRSESSFGFESIWNPNYNFFEIILNYTKMFRLGWSIDEVRKKITIAPINTILRRDTTPINITDKIDMQRDFSINPVAFTQSGILFNTEPSDTDLSEIYKEKTGYNYGEYKLLTNYQFDANIKSLFNKINVVIEEQVNLLTFGELVSFATKEISPGLQATIQGSFRGNNYIVSRKDNKPTSIFGAFGFYGGSVDNASDVISNIYITDDSVKETASALYCYHRFHDQMASTDRETPKLPLIEGLIDVAYHISDGVVHHSAQAISFGIPSTVFYNMPQTRGVYKSLYELMWQRYMEGEFLNIQTKKINCYLKLNILDFNEIVSKRFVILENQLCILNKIENFNYQYGVSQDVRCEFLTVNDMDNYVNSDYFDYVAPNGIGWYLDDNFSSGNHQFYFSDQRQNLQIRCSNPNVNPTITRSETDPSIWKVYIPWTIYTNYTITIYFRNLIDGVIYETEVNTTSFSYA